MIKIVALVFMAGLVAPSAFGLPTRGEILDLCTQRSGLRDKEIISQRLKSDGCAVDCVTKQGTILTALRTEGTRCSFQNDYVCQLGKCIPESNLTKQDDLHSVEIRIKSAHVPDLDSAPGQGLSDIFFVVKVEEGGRPMFEDNEIICHSYVVQDSSFPKWQNYVCKPGPMKRSAILTFDAFDSDKPSTPDYVGSATDTLENLWNLGPKRLTLRQGPEPSNYYVEVDVKAEPFAS